MLRPLLSVLLVLISAPFLACHGESSSVEKARTAMVSQQLLWRGITDQKIIAAFTAVPREEFVLPEFRDRAYEDLEVPIGEGQTIDRPYEDAHMLTAMAIAPHDRILEVGTGSGYLATLMGRLARDVYTIEILAPLAHQAADRLKRLGVTNVHVRAGDGFKGWTEVAPFDAIILTCSPDRVPEPLIGQLKEGGRIVLPLGGEKKFQEILLYRKEKGKIVLVQHLFPATFAPMEGAIKEKVK